MLPRPRRLTQEKDFKIIYKRGRREQLPAFSFLYLPVTTTLKTRFGIVVSSKVDKRATKRNLYKRRLGAALSAWGKNIPPQGYLILVIAKFPIATLTYMEILKQMEVVVGRVFKNTR